VRELKIGVVGYGAIGRHHARNLRTMPGVELVGIADPMPQARAQASEAGIRTFANAKELIALGIDAAIIAVPTSLHEELALDFIERGVAILVEKPLAHSMESAKRIMYRARRHRVPLMVGYVERYNPAMEAVRDFVRAGNLGRPISMSARRVGILPPRIRDANVLIDIGVHDIDMVAMVTGARLNLIAAQGGMAVLNDRLDFATLLINADGCVASVEANWITPVKIREFSITGTHGYCRVDYITQEAWFAPGQHFEPSPDFNALVKSYKDGTLIALPVEKQEPLARELQVFLAGVRGEPLPDPGIALASLRIAEEATEMIGRNTLTIGARELA
jgi:UDP-N-acetylglucosamine 3-dehydrogenase